MPDTEFDQIVVGGGMAGLCCAGELVLRGQRPLLICETKEVGALFAVKTLGENKNNHFFLQHPAWQLGWDGGWWYRLARELNIPLRLYPPLGWGVNVRGTDKVVEVPFCASASALIDLLVEAFSFPLEGAAREALERVLHIALAIPFEELVKMQQVPLAAWLDEQGADVFVQMLLLTICGFPHDLNAEGARRHLSVFGGIGVVRLLLCGEGQSALVYPSPREGLCIPLAKEIERRGGAVWRGRKVARVLVDDGKANGVVFEDGTEVSAPTVAIAVGNRRIPSLLDPLPPEIVEPLSYQGEVDSEDISMFFLLDKPLVQPERSVNAVFDLQTMSLSHFFWPLTGVAPWTTEPGKQLVGVHFPCTTEDVRAAGGEQAIYARIRSLASELYPAFDQAVLDVATFHSTAAGYTWGSSISHYPKLPRTVDSVENLWFVGDGSAPCRGVWTEAAASCGILGAREMVATG